MQRQVAGVPAELKSRSVVSRRQPFEVVGAIRSEAGLDRAASCADRQRAVGWNDELGSSQEHDAS